MKLCKCESIIKSLEDTKRVTYEGLSDDKLLVGVDLGTAYIVLVVLDKNKNPLAYEMEFAQEVKDGLLVDYIGALNILRGLKKKVENKLGIELTKAAIAIPPGTSEGDYKSHIHVVEGVGMEVTNILDEPTAANSVLQIKNGVVVDVGGGTTGLSIFKNGKVIYTADEPTGGTQLSLVIAGGCHVSFEEAEKMKKDPQKYLEIFPMVTPVIQKVASIVKKHIETYDVNEVYLVGGTCCLKGFETVVEKEIGIKTYKPSNPFVITPLGIAMNCL